MTIDLQPPMGATPTRRRWLIYGLLFALTTISYLDRAALSVAAPAIAKALGASPVVMGYLLSSFLWAYLACLIPVGTLVDRFGPGRIAAGGLTLWSLAAMATGLASGLWTMLASRLVLGAGESTVYPAGAQAVREWSPDRERGLATALLNAGAYAGPAFGALVTGWIVATFGWRWGFVVTGGMGLLWLVPWLLSYRKPPPLAATRAAPAPTSASSVLDLLGLRSTWGLMLTQGCVVYTQYLLLSWLPSYLQTEKGLNVQNAGLFTAIPYAFSIGPALAVCHLSDRLAKGRTHEGLRSRMVALMLLVSAVVLLTPFARSMWTITGLITVSLIGVSSAISMNFALASDLARSSRDVGKMTGITAFGGNAFGLVAPIVTGYVIAGTGSYTWAFVIAGALLGVGVVVALTLTRAGR